MSLSREQMLVEMGITPLWVLRDSLQENEQKAPENLAVAEEIPFAQLPSVDKSPHSSSIDQPIVSTPAFSSSISAVDGLDWPKLQDAMFECRACALCQQRKQAVPGVGGRHPDWLFIGDGPETEEDVSGEPFVGQPGKLLDAMLASLDITRGDKVYLTNAVKCRPPGNRSPEATEITACRPWLEAQIEQLKPKIIVLLGKAAMYAVLKEDKALGTLRGQRLAYRDIPVVVTYHPAYLLRNLPDKAKAWEDLLFARRVLRETNR